MTWAWLLALALPCVHMHAAAAANATTQDLPIVKHRLCASTTVLDEQFSTAELSSTWHVRDECPERSAQCWKRDNVQVQDGKLLLNGVPRKDAVDGPAFGAEAAIQAPAVTRSSEAMQLRVRARFPQVDGTVAAIEAHFPSACNTTVRMGWTWSAEAKQQQFYVESTQKQTRLFLSNPCVNWTDEAPHEFRFDWSRPWLRWAVDGVVVHEEPVRCEQDDVPHSKSNVTVRVSHEAPVLRVPEVVPLEIHSINAQIMNAASCPPEQSTELNCKPKTPFVPRLGSSGGYLSLKEIFGFINETVDQLPLYARAESIGMSLEKRPLVALCLGACNTDEKVPQVLFTGMHHSREPISMMGLVYTIDILRNGLLNGDLRVLELLFARQLWFVLVVNPDGYWRNELQSPWVHHINVGQRKNTRPGCDRVLDNGVDLNRNYATCFDHDLIGSSIDVCGEDYRGPAAFSEPETQAIRDFVEREGMNFSVALNYHSFGRYFNLPFSCKDLGLPAGNNNDIFLAIASEMSRYNGFDYGRAWEDSNLYPVNGETSDWMWQKHGIFAMSPEVGPGFQTPSEVGFWPDREDVAPLSSEVHYSNVFAAQVSGAIYNLTIDDLKVQNGSVDADVMISNVGLRLPTTTDAVELMASLDLNGTSLSEIYRLDAVSFGTAQVGGATRSKVHLALPDGKIADFGFYLFLRDSLSCQAFRVSVATAGTESVHQVWLPLPLPRCGVCANLGLEPLSGEDDRCRALKDDTMLEGLQWHVEAKPTAIPPLPTPVQTARASDAPTVLPTPAAATTPNVTARSSPTPVTATPITMAPSPSHSQAIMTPSSSPSAGSHAEGSLSQAPSPHNTAQPNNTAKTASNATVTPTPPLVPVTTSTGEPDSKQSTDDIKTATSHQESWQSWSTSSFLVFPLGFFALGAFIYAVRRFRRQRREQQGANPSRYARVAREDESSGDVRLSVQGRTQESDDEDEEYGHRRSPNRRTKSPSPPTSAMV